MKIQPSFVLDNLVCGEVTLVPHYPDRRYNLCLFWNILFAWLDHLGSIFPEANSFFDVNTGHAKVCTCFISYSTWIELSSSCLNIPSSSTGKLLWRRAALRRVYSHNTKCPAAGQWARAWSSCMQAPSDRSRIACSAIPFWKWAFTPQKVSHWRLALHDCIQALSEIVRYHSDSVGCGHHAWLNLKCLLGKHGFCGRVINLEMHQMQSREVIHKNSAIPVSILGERPLQLGEKVHLCWLHLVNWDYLPWLGGNKDFVRRCHLSATPR